MGFSAFRKADHIVVKQWSKTTLTTITKPSQIAEIARFVEAHEAGWSVPFGGTPVGSVSMEFYSGATYLGDFAVGKTFVEAQGCGYFFSRKLSTADRGEISRLIGIPDGVIQ
jgi:hypothetical protein